MRLVPRTASRSYTSSSERRVFKLLEAVPDKGITALHSLNLSEHSYQRAGELDFLLAGPKGLFALEVKGGRVARRDGIWTITDRNGHTRREQRGPFKQAEDGIHSLVRKLRAGATSDLVRDMCFGYGVVLPDVTFDDPSVEWAPSMVCDAERIRQDGGLAPFRRGRIDYWWAKGDYRSRSDAELTGLLDALRPDFVRVPSLRHRTDELEEEFVALTDEQYERLELIETSPRILCSGGAGTGKTFLALETARQERDMGSEVAITCASPHLRDFIRRQADVADIKILSPGDLASIPGGAIDCLVVDEAQDVMTLDHLTIFDRVLRGGLEQGRWRIFFDPNNQAGLLGPLEPEAIDFLTSCGAPTPTLKRNCRNTKPIVAQTQLLTGADIGKPAAGAGPAPTIAFHASPEDAAAELAEYLDHLIEQDIAPEDIVIITCAETPRSCLEQLPGRWRRRTCTGGKRGHASAIAVWPVADFKGLESPHVCLIDVASLADSGLASVYVGMTRARVTLWVSLDKRIEADAGNRARANAARGAVGGADE